MALFGPSDGGSREPKSLVEFRAGKMKLNETTHMVTPDNRKGLVYMKMDQNGLLHFYWRDRTSSAAEDDLIIFPDDAEMKRVTQCTTGRVYLLRFKNSKRRFFYWMQEPKEEGDIELIKKVNDLINNPPEPSIEEEDAAGALQALLGGGAGGIGDREQLLEMLQQSGRFGGMSSQLFGSSGAMMRASQGSGAERGRSSASGVTPSSSSAESQPVQGSSRGAQQASQVRVQLSDLQSALTSIGVQPPRNVASEPTAGYNDPDQLNLSQVVTGDALRDAARDTNVAEQLRPLLPETGEEAVDVVTSPQFQQAMRSFGAALNSGQLGPLMGQFGLGREVIEAANRGDTGAFVTAMQGEQTGSSQPTDGEHQLEGVAMEQDDTAKDDKSNDNDDTMSVD